MSDMDELTKLVDSLYEYRENFFNVHKISEASDKPVFLKERLLEVLGEFEKVEELLKSKAVYFLLKGKALNVTEEYNAQAEMLLSRAVKLDPMLSEAWSCLGDCYWKNDKLDAARDCFISSISHKKNKEALRYLSNITRVLSRDKSCVEDSIQMAKEALQMDFKDGRSWLNLGNAYLAMYFSCLNGSISIKQALSAYNHAEQNATTRHDYTLYFNKANALEYLENFQEALSSLYSANQLNPTFKEGHEKEVSLLEYLHAVTTMVRTKGKMREKRLKSLIDKIKPAIDIGTFAPTFAKDVKDSFKTIDQLSEGSNAECLLVGRVVGLVYCERRLCQTFCLIDKQSNCVAVMLYNVSQKWSVHIGDSIVINEPSFRHVSINHHPSIPPSDSITISPLTPPAPTTPFTLIDFPAIRVESPLHLIVNARKPSGSSIAPVTLSLSMQSD